MKRGDTAAVAREIAAAKRRFGLPEDARVVSCYEAGPDGFWPHRWLVAAGVENVVVDSASIEVNRRRRRANSDGLDVVGLLKLLCRHTMGEPKVWSVVRVLPPQIEDARQLHRDLATLTEERTRIRNRMRGLLAVHGASIRRWSKVREEVATMHVWDGSPLGDGLRRRLEREIERLELVQRQIRASGRDGRIVWNSRPNRGESVGDKMQQLEKLRGIGPQGGRIMAVELFAWRQFHNRRQVGGCGRLDADTVPERGYAARAGDRQSGQRVAAPGGHPTGVVVGALAAAQ